MKFVRFPNCLAATFLLTIVAELSVSAAQHDVASAGNLRSRVEKAYSLGRRAMLAEKTLELDTIWVLQQFLRSHSDPELQLFVQARIEDYPDHPMRKLVVPDAPRFELPERLGQGIERLTNFALAPFGSPVQRALAFITDYLSEEASGYILTHQLLVLEWAEQIGLRLPPVVLEKRGLLIEKMLREQSVEKEFSDLYAERVALLLLYGKPAPQAVQRWVEEILNSQQPDGTWGLHSWAILYDSETAHTKPQKTHTMALALLALRLYLDRY